MQTPANPYLRAKVLTASPEQLQLMLYDGAIRFTDKGRQALIGHKYDESYDAFTRAGKIVTELSCTLRQDVAPDLCRNLAGLYSFVYSRLVTANIEHDTKAADEALDILRYQRETWVLLMRELAAGKAASAAASIPLPGPGDRDSATNTLHVERLSMTG